MALLTVKTFDLRARPPKDKEFDRAWYRLNNEDTNQTIDYKLIKQVEKPEGFDEDLPLEEGIDPNDAPPRVEIVYIAGRLFYEKQSGRWVYESYNNCFTSDKFPDSSPV